MTQKSNAPGNARTATVVAPPTVIAPSADWFALAAAGMEYREEFPRTTNVRQRFNTGHVARGA